MQSLDILQSLTTSKVVSGLKQILEMDGCEESGLLCELTVLDEYGHGDVGLFIGNVRGQGKAGRGPPGDHCGVCFVDNIRAAIPKKMVASGM